MIAPARVVDEAVDWLVVLWSGEADESQLAAWRRWRAAHPDHERAWRHIESVDGRLRQGGAGVSAEVALKALDAPASAARRCALKALGVVALAGSGALAGRTQAWAEWTADVRVARGERRTMVLADGTQLHINSDSAVDIRFDAQQRRLHVHRGEIQVVTAADTQQPPRPLAVGTQAGQVHPIGTRFVVRVRDGQTRVAVTEGAVQLQPRHGGPILHLAAGQSAGMTADTAGPADPLGAETAWVDGLLVASDTRLAEVVAELSRHHPARLSCAPEVADWRVSGVFPLDDPERVLQALGEVLPLRQQRLAGFWVRLLPASG